MKDVKEFKELEEMEKFMKEHPHSKSGQLWYSDIERLLNMTRGDMIKMIIYSYRVGFIRGIRTQKKLAKKEQAEQIRKKGAA